MTAYRPGGIVRTSKTYVLGDHGHEVVRPIAYHRILTHPYPSRSRPMDAVLARAKALAAVLVPLVAAGVAALGIVDVTNWWLAIVAVLTAAGVYAVPNKQPIG